jgi:hypothetical protein
MSFRVTGLDAAPFQHLFGLSDDELARQGVRFFVNPDIAYLQAHYAKRGCYAARISRA